MRQARVHSDETRKAKYIFSPNIFVLRNRIRYPELPKWMRPPVKRQAKCRTLQPILVNDPEQVVVILSMRFRRTLCNPVSTFCIVKIITALYCLFFTNNYLLLYIFPSAFGNLQCSLRQMITNFTLDVRATQNWFEQAVGKRSAKDRIETNWFLPFFVFIRGFKPFSFRIMTNVCLPHNIQRSVVSNSFRTWQQWDSLVQNFSGSRCGVKFSTMMVHDQCTYCTSTPSLIITLFYYFILFC